MKIKKAIIPSAGLGTRFLPATKAQPKEMLPIIDKPTIQYIVEEAVSAGIEDILIITGRNKRAIEDHFDISYELEHELLKKSNICEFEQVRHISHMANIYYIRQKESKGLGHAINCGKSFIGNEPFAVLLGDDIVDSKVPCIKQLIDLYETYNSTILGVQKVPWDCVNKYGIIKGEKMYEKFYKVSDFVEKPQKEQSPSDIAVLGRYILTPEIFDILDNTSVGVGGEIQLTDAIRELSKSQDLYAYVFDGKRYDIGDKLGFLKANIEFALKRPELNSQLKDYLNSLLR